MTQPTTQDGPAPHRVGGLTLSVLGQLGGAVDGTPLDLGGRQQRAVLGVLLVAHGAVVPAERIIDAVYGEEAPPRASSALQSYISHLRRRLEPGSTARARGGVIVSVGAGYALRVPDDAVDAWRFERLLERAQAGPDALAAPLLREALALWHGPAYMEYADAGWAQPEAVRLTELLEVARERLVAARLACGESDVVVPDIEQLVAGAPLREERWRLLALALYRSGRQADALAALRRARTLLADELGVDPGPALRAVEAEVLAQSPSLDAPAAAGAVPAASTPPRVQRSRASDVLVDRDRELRTLRAAVDDLAAGTGGVVLIDGPPGIGKTRLLAQARDLASEVGVRVLTARGSQMEKEFAFGVLRQLFEPLLVDPERRSLLLAGAAASAAAVFDTATPATVGSTAPPPTTWAEATARRLGTTVAAQHRPDGTFSALHGLYWLTVNLAAVGPVLLVIDDLQWVDAGSLRALAYIARRLEGLPVLVAATLRTGEVHEDQALIAEITQDPATVSVRPAPLTRDGVEALVKARLGADAAPAFVEACYRTTTGNPLLLRQMLRALEVEGVRPDAAHAQRVTAVGSRAVSSLVLMRLSRMPSPATQVARAVAVLGDGAPLPLLAALAGVREAEAAAAVAALARAEVVRDEPPLGFVHPLVRDAVYRDLPPGERELHHERAVRVLTAAGATPEQVAAHLLQIPPRGDTEVVAVLREAAGVAQARGAHDAALAYLERALLEPPGPEERPHVLRQLGLVETVVNGPGAVQHLRESYLTLPVGAEREEVSRLLAWTLVFAGAPAEATAFASRAAAELPGASAADSRQALAALGRIAGFMHGLDPAVWASDPPPEMAGDGPGAQMLAADVAWELLVRGVERERAIELARFALAGGRLLEVDNGLTWVVAAAVLELADEDVMPFWESTLAEAYRRGSLFMALSINLWRGFTLYRRGRLVEADESLAASAEQTHMWGAPNVGVPYGEAFRILVAVDRGDFPAAESLMAHPSVMARVGDGARLWEEARAALAIADSRWEEALAAADAVRGLMTSVENPAWRPWRSLKALPLARLGRLGEATELMHEELALARRWGAPTVVGQALRRFGQLGGSGSEELLREAVEVLRGTRARLQLGRSLSRLAALVSEVGEQRRLLDEALELASVCGSEGLRVETVQRLRRLGVEVSDVPLPPPLTVSEQRVADLSSRGAGPREIAEELFLTPARVEAMLRGLAQR